MSDTIHKRKEKIASAIYLITGFFPDQEPVKWRLRGLAADLISESVKDKNSSIREISSLFSLAKHAQLVSGLNYEIIVGELGKLEETLEKPLNELFISTGIRTEETSRIPAKETIIKDIPSAPMLPELAGDHGVSKGQGAPRSERAPERKPLLKEFGAVSVKKNGRQTVIIGLLKRKKEVMIKDVMPLVSNCSEKTVQRELLAMVSAGILRKIGEKRWSRYTLA